MLFSLINRTWLSCRVDTRFFFAFFTLDAMPEESISLLSFVKNSIFQHLHTSASAFKIIRQSSIEAKGAKGKTECFNHITFIF